MKDDEAQLRGAFKPVFANEVHSALRFINGNKKVRASILKPPFLKITALVISKLYCQSVYYLAFSVVK